MAKRLNDDLFEGTTMSFGEHLEELRKSLFKSMFGLVIGALLGMLVANWVVKQIQTPLARALTNFYVEKAVDEIKAKYPGEVPAEVVAFIEENKFVYEEEYHERNLLKRLVAEPDVPEEKPSTDSGAATENSSSAEQEPEKGAPNDPAGASAEALAESWSWKSFLKYLGYGEEDRPVDPHGELSILAKQKLPPPDTHMVKIRVWRPLDIRITSLSAQEVFMIWVKASLIAGMVISSPYIFYQIWHFVAAGLYPHEKNYVYLYLPFSLGLFLAGAALAFFFVFDPVLDFLFQFNKSMGIDPDPRINEWLGFVLYMPLGFGVSFQLPLVMLFLNRIGIFSIEQYLAKWRIAILTIFVISMVLTPADPMSMLFMAFPLTFLYFFGVGLCKWMPRGRNPFDEAYEV
jgi:sec-independent protein translocase protein TatC